MAEKVPAHDFGSSIASATTDANLKAQLTKFLRTAELIPPGRSAFTDTTCDIITWAIQEARGMYASDPQRLKCVISASAVANALAIWGTPQHDWIVVSEGLMQRLLVASDDMGDRMVAAFPELTTWPLWQSLQAIPPLAGGPRTMPGCVLYFAAITFFVGHEAGHHLGGHDGYYRGGAHAEAQSDEAKPPDPTRFTEQALEHEADQIGLTICRFTVTRLLLKLCSVQAYNDIERRKYQRSLAILLGGGAMMAVALLKPEEIEDWTKVATRTHPPEVLRILNLAVQLSAVIGATFNDLDAVSRQWIRVQGLELAVAATIKPNSKEDVTYRERLARGGEPAATRAVGIRKALYDPQRLKYNRDIAAALKAVRPRLRSRIRQPV
jgi:hypothetical protein